MKKFSSTLTVIAIVFLLATTTIAGLEPRALAASYDTSWQLTVTGLVNETLKLTIADLMVMPQTTIFAQIYCVGPPGFFVEEGN